MGKQVNTILKEICGSLGYEYYKKGDIFVKPYTTNIISTIGFMIASYRVKGHRFIAPIIGVILEDVEKILRVVSGAEYLKKYRYTNTVSEHIGYIMPMHKWKEWDLIEPGTNSEIILDDLKESLRQYSDVYCRRFSSIEDVIAVTDMKYWNPCNYALFERLPIMYYIIGRKQKGLDFINKALKEFLDADMLFTEEYISNYMKLPDNPLDIK
ncbi:MAG: hypothetical protein ACI3ZQ_10195 [Candidatus Cryptobacteroides sp.]